MNIAIFGVRGYPSTYSGYETIVGELAPRFVQAGHQVTVYCRSGLSWRPPSLHKGVRLYYLPSLEHKAFSTLSHGLIASLHAALAQYDIVLAMNAANGPFGLFFRLLRRPSLLNVDGLEWLRPKWNPLGRRVFHLCAWLGTRLYDRIVTDAAEMQRQYDLLFQTDSTYIAYGANIVSHAPCTFLQQHNLQPRQYYLIASRLVPDNNADLIIEAFCRTPSSRQLVIAGGADYRGNQTERSFRQQLAQLADSRVLFLGHISDPDAIAQLHVHCYAYLHGHQFGGINPSLLKALGYGNCVLALDTPFNREVLHEQTYGLLFRRDPSHLAALLHYLDLHPDVPHHYRQQAQQPIAQRFTWTRIAQQYLQLFQQLSPQHSAPS